MSRILLAEDDESLRGFLARALEKAGYEVTACADGEEAAAALDGPWDMLLTDIGRGGVAGIAVARLAGEKRPGSPIMFLHAFAAGSRAAAEAAAPGAKVLAKPIHLREIVAEIQKVLPAAAA